MKNSLLYIRESWIYFNKSFLTLDICALRFDFETTTDLAQPSNVGACSDGFEVDGGSNYDLAKLCGTLTGTHSKNHYYLVTSNLLDRFVV